MNAADPWDGLLDPGEEIIWQGQPAPGVQFEWGNAFMPFFFLFFTGFSVFWMVMASQAGGVFWMFGLLFFGTGAYNLVGVHFWRAFQRRGTFYTLTSKRAFIATQTMGRKTLDSYPITADTPLQLEEGRLSAIWFAESEVRGQKGTYTRKIGFERLKNGRDVFAKLREIQRGAAPEQAG